LIIYKTKPANRNCTNIQEQSYFAAIMSAELNPLDLVGERKKVSCSNIVLETTTMTIIKPIPTMTLPSTLVSSFATMALAMTLSTSSENLDIFDRELPDAHQQLSIQLGKDLEMFTIFNELPIELRLKIWRLAFPAARKVNLCGDSRATTWEGDKLPAWKSMTVTQVGYVDPKSLSQMPQKFHQFGDIFDSIP
jgi:hypothetical protein